ncbi:MAG TPA: DUF4038 domain-containing protein [Thermoanaerobaculia bacterium]
MVQSRRGNSGNRQRLFKIVLGLLLLALLPHAAAGQTCPAPQSPVACQETSTVNQWRCWQKTLRSTGYAGANAYRDLEITVEFRNASTNALVRSGWGFWDCTETTGQEAFRIRTALPAGAGGAAATYKWDVRCRKRAGAPASVKDCATDPNLNSSSYLAGGLATGTFTVNAATVANDRYDRGFLQIAPSNRRFLKQGSTSVPFFWLADTAWAAGKKATRSGDWATYLDSRKKQGFSVILLGTTPHFAGITEAEAFQQLTGCTSDGTVVPNNCSRWNPPYWQQLEAKIQDANAKGLVVAMAGVMEPFAYPSPTLGSPTWLSIFARNLAARLAGHHVILSPGFDHALTSQSQTLANSVGAAMDQAAPAHLVTHHAGGKSTCADYTIPLQAQTWHDFHLFQSGHCKNLRIQIQPGQEQPCDPRRDYPPFNQPDNPGPEDETAVHCVTRRARTMSEDLFKATAPTKPVANGEAVYDGNPASPGSATPPDSRPYVRQTAYLSALSGSFGFTYGADYFTLWNVTSSTLSTNLGPVPTTVGTVPTVQAHSAWDMQKMASLFKMRPWKDFSPDPAKILNQQTAEDKKMVFARSSNFFFNMAYLPNNSGDRIRLNLSSLVPAFTCGSLDWTPTWINPLNNVTEPAKSPSCQSIGSGVYEFTKPGSCCEWVLVIDKTGAKVNEEGEITAVNALQVWPELTAEDTLVRGQALTANGELLGPPVNLNDPSDGFFRKQPFVARGPGGSFLVVWESEHQDGSMWGIFGRRFDNQGRSLGSEFQVNTHIQHDQAEPAAAASPSGASVVVWMSFDQDGDFGGIFAQRYDHNGNPDGAEFQVNSLIEGHQSSPLAGMSKRGDFVVAWESAGQEGEPVRVFARRFDRLGLPLGPEFAVDENGQESQTLAHLEVQPNGEFEIVWYEYDAAGTLLRSSSRRFLNRR